MKRLVPNGLTKIKFEAKLEFKLSFSRTFRVGYIFKWCYYINEIEFNLLSCRFC